MKIYNNRFKSIKLKILSGLTGLSLITSCGCGSGIKGLGEAISNPIRKYEANDYCSLAPAWDILSEDEESYHIVNLKPDGDIVEMKIINKSKLKKRYGTSKLKEERSILGKLILGD
jgi:hypothetical protein